MIAFSYLIPSIVWGLLLAANAHGQWGFVSGNAEGKAFRIKLDLDQIERTPPWNPNSEDAPPLSIQDALRAAKAAMFKQFPSRAETNWEIAVCLKSDGINLPNEMVSDGLVFLAERRIQRHIYFIRFVDSVLALENEERLGTDGRVNANPIDQLRSVDFTIAVLMDGTVVVPKPIEKKLGMDEPNDAHGAREVTN